jgi:hypothetical protein
MPLEMFEAQADLVTHEFIAELESIQLVGPGSGWKTAGLARRPANGDASFPDAALRL